MDYKTLIYTKNDSVLTISLNRPEVYNAINDLMSFELQDAFAKAANDNKIRVIVLTGIGKAFCSGQDLKAFVNDEKRPFLES